MHGDDQPHRGTPEPPAGDASAITVRLPRPEEAAVIAEVQNTGWREAYGAFLPERFYDDAALASRMQMWDQVLSGAQGRQNLRVAELDGVIIGFAARGPIRDADVDRLDGRRSHQLHALYVLEQHYGTGAGDQLLESVLEQAPSCLWVFRDNPRALRFYRKHGFLPDGAEKDLGDEEGSQELRGLVEIRMLR